MSNEAFVETSEKQGINIVCDLVLASRQKVRVYQVFSGRKFELNMIIDLEVRGVV
jgi:hypothetical protein